MAEKRSLMCDKTEILVVDSSGRNVRTHNLTYDQITTIQFDKCTAKKLFKTIPSEKIAISVRGLESPVLLLKHQEGPLFEEYKEQLEAFAKAHRITFHNYL